jgi:predicted HTH transcriptional regulator
MSPEALEALLVGAQETDSIDFKAAMSWDKKTFVKDILALANVIDGGAIIVGVEDGTFARQGLSDEQIDSFDYDIMRDQVAPYADPRVVFSKEVLQDANGMNYVVIEVAPFEEIPVICARGGHDVQEGDIYYRSRSRRPQSARVARADDMREIIETAISRRSRSLRRAGFLAAEEGPPALDEELGGL